MWWGDGEMGVGEVRGRGFVGLSLVGGFVAEGRLGE
jgi:hypothetical protein